MQNDPQAQPVSQGALYLYCFVQAGRLEAIAAPALDERSDVFIYPWGEIAAVLSRVSSASFTAEHPTPSTEDIAWLLPRAYRHERVIEEAMRHSPVFPVRFGTLFSSRQSLQQEISQRYALIHRSLAAVAGRTEWALKGQLDRGVAIQALFSQQLAQQQQGLSSSPGMRHLQEQRIRREAEQRLKLWLQSTCTDIAAQLAELADGFSQRKILAVAEQQTEVILNWAFLVTESATDAFHAHIAHLNQTLGPQGLTLQCTGPWPPYSFCESSE
ncbi:GvpL/GvpF family gas vesicle protein [Shewanella salipaludis]|uniref:GvpL/GvpF family gas vesicle protein n=1 Tax=Shewanella salipaludis TaxID=2723052 RepID=A0A972G3D0_9GAMM|nr:GvpL/GvpF family gas vesicle protein [Shewanella salipaludis]NMH66464.1 GvpL/GvpF family gas vesicle protein [Shewanella salipaludis]